MFRRIAMLATVALALSASLLFAAPASAGGSCHEPTTAVKGTEVGMSAGCFTPNVLHVAPGEEITFVNASGVTHTVEGLGGEWRSDLLDGQTARFRFDEAGVYPFYCHVHMGMVGSIIVGDGAAPGLETVVAKPQAPEILEQGVETVTDAVEEVAPAAAATPSEPSTPAIAIGAAMLGLVGGLVLRGRLRSVP